MRALVGLAALLAVGCQKPDYKSFEKLCAEGRAMDSLPPYDASVSAMPVYAAVETSPDYWIGDDALFPEGFRDAGVESAWRGRFERTPVAVCVELEKTSPGRDCPFPGGKTLKLLNADFRAKFVEAKTARVLVEETFSVPAAECPELVVMSNKDSVVERTPAIKLLQPYVGAFLVKHLPAAMKAKAQAALANQKAD